MTTIPQVAETIQTILTDEADRAGWQTGFAHRHRSLACDSIRSLNYPDPT